MGKAKGRAWVGFSSYPSEKELYLDKPHDASGSHHRRDEEIPKTRTIYSFRTRPLAKQKARSFARSALLSNEKTWRVPINGRWLANLSAWGKVIEFTAEMLHKRSEIRWLHTKQSTL